MNIDPEFLEIEALANQLNKRTMADARKALTVLKGFIGQSQLRTIRDLMSGEEGQFFIDKVCEYAERIKQMPHTYQTQDEKDPVVWLHYFGPSQDFYITEKDKCPFDPDEPEAYQSQSFGLADLFRDGGEMGYISIPEITASSLIEIDLHWTPKLLSVVKEERNINKYRFTP